MAAVETAGLREFLRSYPKMAIRPSSGEHLRLKGSFEFVAHHAKEGEIQDSFALEIIVPSAFPKALPSVTETGEKIPRTGEYHVNQTDNTLCLGSPLSLLLRLSKNPGLDGFAENCLVPYLFSISRKLKIGGSLPFGELAHGPEGILTDYAHLFGLKHSESVKYALGLLGTKARRANKLPCPCGCGSRLGRCKFNLRLREFRNLASRSWFRKERLGLR
jgi:hypothetical protein